MATKRLSTVFSGLGAASILFFMSERAVEGILPHGALTCQLRGKENKPHVSRFPLWISCLTHPLLFMDTRLIAGTTVGD